jgi:hypothetical protein
LTGFFEGFGSSDIEQEEQEVELATLSVCKTVASVVLSAEDFVFTVTGNNPSPAQFLGDPDCVDVTIGPGEYEIIEVNTGPIGNNFDTRVFASSDCVQDPNVRSSRRATGEIQAGETQECRFLNFLGT